MMYKYGASNYDCIDLYFAIENASYVIINEKSKHA